MRFAPVLLLSTLLTAAVVAQQPPTQAPGSKNPAAITGGTYTADAGHTLVEWTVDHLGFTPYFGLFGNITGTLTLDPKNLAAAKVDVSIPVAEVTTASAGLTKHLLKPADAGKAADFFGAAPAPARFVSTRVTPSGQTAKIAGNLTLNGVTRPVTLDAAFYGAGKMPAQMGGKENVGFTATTSIRRSEFNVGYGIPMVSDEVKLKITAAFQK
ncbi:polyisoprenoid-binding protein [Sphingomonas sp. NBWT7]|uniref:YceI family protein n=1 Tax=Sphingomonas sp. NBWT7 TaxID=2596913 RepID=UPI00162517EB|nr:YceI family protein [Sphingomonas sp. NBWT7]QNE31433.1 polyisoprenoid-binding protein [Sphingomonas sp. NBWT7]